MSTVNYANHDQVDHLAAYGTEIGYSFLFRINVRLDGSLHTGQSYTYRRACSPRILNCPLPRSPLVITLKLMAYLNVHIKRKWEIRDVYKMFSKERHAVVKFSQFS